MGEVTDSASAARAASDSVCVVETEQWMYTGGAEADGWCSGALPFALVVDGGGDGGGFEGRRRDVESGVEGGRRAPEAMRRMGQVR